jgi:hypothetical protein
MQRAITPYNARNPQNIWRFGISSMIRPRYGMPWHTTFHRVAECFGPKNLAMKWAQLELPQSDLVSCCAGVAVQQCCTNPKETCGEWNRAGKSVVMWKAEGLTT